MKPRLLHEAILTPNPERDDRPAVEWPTGALTHRELRESAMGIAAQLIKMGVRKGDRVVICMSKCPEAVQLLLATLICGGAYVPLDASAPAARVMQMIEDAEPARVFVSESVHQKWMSEGVVIPQDDRLAVVGTLAGNGLDDWHDHAYPTDLHEVSTDDTAIILYTSGSTGQPKGVMLSHANVCCFVDWATGHFNLSAEDAFTSLAPFHFDLSTLDLFAPLALGARVFLIDEKIARFPVGVARAISQKRLSVLYAAPTALRMMLESGILERVRFPELRLVLFAGEVFPVKALAAMMQALPDAKFANLYGPTETNVCTCHLLDEPPDDQTPEIPIGLPCAHVEITLRRDDEDPSRDGGEICVTGPAVMRGYWRDDRKTALSRLDGRVDSFCTGDYGMWNADGTLRFLGRRDHQVKLRGHRIELQEIETHLMTHPRVRQSAVVLQTSDGQDPVLVAFVQADGRIPAEELAGHCASRLSAVAVPSRFILLDTLPLTSTGKVDRVRLADMAGGSCSFDKFPAKG